MDGLASNDTREAILRDLTAMLHAVVGEDWVHEAPIALETTFSRDLEVESIELVVLFEKLRERYGDAIDFPGWLSGMDVDAVMHLTVGDLVDYIAVARTAAPKGGSAPSGGSERSERGGT